MRSIKKFYSLIIILLIITSVFSEPNFKVTAILDKDSYNPGDTVIVALQCRIPKRFHLYGNPLGPGIGKPLRIEVSENTKISWFTARKQSASKFKPPVGDWVWAYEDETVFFIIGIVAKNATGQINDTVTLDGLICEKACIPITETIPFIIPVTRSTVKSTSFENNKMVRKEFFLAEKMPITKKSTEVVVPLQLDDNLLNLSIDLKDRQETSIPDWEYEPQESRFRFNIVLAIVLAFLAGIILNVMPCVLPVLGIKILSFSQGAGSTRRVAVLRSVVFAAGMILIFLVLASFAAFAGLSWGEQFQNPKVLVGIVSIIFVFALGMFDVFMVLVPASITNLEQKSTKGKEYVDDFIKGMFTTILATPCSGPLLGATLAWTLLQPPVVIYMVFAAIGIGMASPYVLFSASSRLLKLIPKPGPWMEDFKHVMGFLLIGFALYLMIGLPKDMILPTIGLCTFLTFALMVYTRFSPFGASIKRKITVGVISLLLAVFGWHVNFNVLYNFISEDAALHAEMDSGEWEKFTPEKLLNAHAQGRHVIVDFTANWCMNCQFNKITVYHTKEVNEVIKQKNIRALKADLTQENPAAESLLHHLGSRSVPFFAVFPGDDPYSPVIMRDVLNKKSVMKVLSGLTDRRR